MQDKTIATGQLSENLSHRSTLRKLVKFLNCRNLSLLRLQKPEDKQISNTTEVFKVTKLKKDNE